MARIFRSKTGQHSKRRGSVRSESLTLRRIRYFLLYARSKIVPELPAFAVSAGLSEVLFPSSQPRALWLYRGAAKFLICIKRCEGGSRHARPALTSADAAAAEKNVREGIRS
jgi:hypothetical protein